MTGYGISPIGTYGLDASSAYSSFDPYMMSMGMTGINGMTGMTGINGMMGMNGLGTMSPYAMGGMGMMGMYDPSFMSQYMKAQQDIEKSQLKHTSDMHALLQETEVQNLSAHERSIFEGAMVDGDIQQGIRNLADAVRSGNQDAICKKMDEVKQMIYLKHGNYFVKNSKNMTSDANVNNFITLLYNKMMSQGGTPVDLKTEIKEYGDDPFWHGFNKAFLGKTDYHKKYSEETLEYCFGDSIDNKAGKKRLQNIGGWAGRIAEGALALGTGIIGGSLVSGLTGKGLSGITGGKVSSFIGKLPFGKTGAWLGGLGLLAADIMWQMSRD